MTVALCTRDDKVKEALTYHLGPMGFELVQYTNPVTLMNELEDLAAEILVVSAVDFPRHWKPLGRMLRLQRTKEEAILILLTGPDFPFDEAAKASHLGVNGIISADLSNKTEVYRLKDIVGRYKTLKEQRRIARLVPRAGERLGFAFTHPQKHALVLGSVADISERGVTFKPTTPKLVADLRTEEAVDGASLRIGDLVVAVDCQVTRAGEVLGFRFNTIYSDGGHALTAFIEHHNSVAGRSQER